MCHWNMPLDALPGSATFVRVLDRWLNDCWLPETAFFVSLLYRLGELTRGVATTLRTCANFGTSHLLFTTVVALRSTKSNKKRIETSTKTIE